MKKVTVDQRFDVQRSFYLYVVLFGFLFEGKAIQQHTPTAFFSSSSIHYQRHSIATDPRRPKPSLRLDLRYGHLDSASVLQVNLRCLLQSLARCLVQHRQPDDILFLAHMAATCAFSARLTKAVTLSSLLTFGVFFPIY